MKTLRVLLPLAVVLTLNGQKGAPYVPPPLPDPFDIPFPMDPPDPWDIPFDPGDLPEPWDLPLPPEDPFDDPFEDFPLPDPFEMDDPFPDIPSILPDPFDGPPDSAMPPLPPPGITPQSTGLSAAAVAVANKVQLLMPFPARLPFPPASTAHRAPTTAKRVCDPNAASELIVPEPSKGDVVFVDTCPWKVSGHVPVTGSPYKVGSANDGGAHALVITQSPAALYFLDLSTRKVSGSIMLPGDATLNNFVVSPDGSFAYVSSHDDSRFFVVDLMAKRIVNTLIVGASPSGMAISPDGSQVWVNCRGDGVINIIDTMTQSVIYTIQNVTRPTGIAFNPTGTLVYSAEAPDSGNGDIMVIDAATYAPMTTIPVGAIPHVVRVTPSGRFVFVNNGVSNSITMINAASNKVIRTINLPSGYQHPVGLTFIQ